MCIKVSLAKLADDAWSLGYYKNMIAEITDMKGSAAENFINQCKRLPPFHLPSSTLRTERHLLH